jgi:hypothetical protein
MQFGASKLALVSQGSGSNIYAYGDNHDLILKVVKQSSKEAKHLIN